MFFREVISVRSVKMKFVIIFATLFAIAVAAPQKQDAQAAIVSQNAAISSDHSSYSYSHQSDNGISASQSGTLRQSKSPENNEPAYGYATQGEYTYFAPGKFQLYIKNNEK